MVKFFMHTYDIPTKRDVDKIMARLERIEALVASAPAAAVAGRRKTARRRNGGVPAADAVLDAIKRSKQGLKFADLQSQDRIPGQEDPQHHLPPEQAGQDQASHPGRVRGAVGAPRSSILPPAGRAGSRRDPFRLSRPLTVSGGP